MAPFTHLHTHSVYTHGNSTLRIDDLVKKIKADGMTATALVDSGTIAGFTEFSTTCARHGIAPIYGCGFYLAKGSLRAPKGRTHLVLLAYNEEGMQNLAALDAIAQSDGFHDGKAHIDDVLLPIHSSGLICLTGGLGGLIDQTIVAGEMEHALRYAKFYHHIFKENYYLELQDHGGAKNQTAIKGLCEISVKTGIRTLVTQGAFYLDSADAEGCNQLRNANGNNALTGHQYHLRTAAEMRDLFRDFPKALATTERVAAQCLLRHP